MSLTPEESVHKIRHNIMIARACGQGYSPPGKQEAEADREGMEARAISQEHASCDPALHTGALWREHFIAKP